MIESIADALEAAEKAVGGEYDHQRGDLVAYVGLLEWDQLSGPADELIDDLTQLAVLLMHLDLRLASRKVIRTALHLLEVVDAQEVRPTLWGRLGVLLADHGELDEARVTLRHALGKARYEGDVGSQIEAMANLGATCLAADDRAAAKLWAEQAHDLASRHEVGLDCRVLIASTLTGVAIRLGDVDSLETAFAELEGLAQSYRKDEPCALVVQATVAGARYEVARARGLRHMAADAIDELEVITQRMSATLGAGRLYTVAAVVNLGIAEYQEATERGEGDRRLGAFDTLSFASLSSAANLGGEHPLAVSALRSLRQAREDAAELLGEHQQIDRIYSPAENEQRNRAKRAALERETERVRLVAHAGASFLIEPLQRFVPHVIQALEHKVRFEIIISNPWNSIGLTVRREDQDPDSLISQIEGSDYYLETFRPVIEAYSAMRERFGRTIELRVTPVDIPGTTLLTSTVGFFEPYIGTNPEARSGRGMDAFEVEFSPGSRSYAVTEQAFAELWGSASSLTEFLTHEAAYKDLLSRLVKIPESGTSP